MKHITESPNLKAVKMMVSFLSAGSSLSVKRMILAPGPDSPVTPSPHCPVFLPLTLRPSQASALVGKRFLVTTSHYGKDSSLLLLREISLPILVLSLTPFNHASDSGPCQLPSMRTFCTGKTWSQRILGLSMGSCSKLTQCQGLRDYAFKSWFRQRFLQWQQLKSWVFI